MANVKGSPDMTAIMQEMVKLQQANEKLQAALDAKSKAHAISYGVVEPRAVGTNGPTDKGTKGGSLSMYGLGRFPVSLYRGQWERVIEEAKSGRLEAAIEAHSAKLTSKV